MAEVEERQFNSLAERIAALNQQRNFSSTGDGPKKPPAPPPPPGRNGVAAKTTPALPARPQKRDTAPTLPRRTTNTENALEIPGRRAPPPLPTRTNTDSSQPSPALPPRRPSTQNLRNRRGSNESDMSHMSTVSSLSLRHISSRSSVTSTETQPQRRLPPALDQAKLPPLPPTKREREAQAEKEAAEKQATEALPAPIRSIKSAPIVPQVHSQPKPSLPPRVPSRPSKSPAPHQSDESTPSLPRRLPPPPVGGFTRAKGTVEPSRSPVPQAYLPTPDGPPRVPLSSRPTMAQIDAVASRAAVNAAITCLLCRDFSRPDTIAAQYPKDSLPRNDPVGYLANVLCSPFPSATDKARAIFTWCHYNIAYNVREFFGKCVQHRSVEETIFCGLAVCQGYAEVYQAVAQRAGLECVVVGGHGKGYGYEPLAAGQRPPPRDPSGHAWNAVRIDNGEWKLLDACWGAGHLCNDLYKQEFSPSMFSLSNELFGLKHFPKDSRHFYRSDGRIPTWEEYMIGPTKGEKAKWYSTGTQEGISEFTFSPAEKNISVYSGETIRFQFSKICEHWNPEKHGQGKNHLLMMKIHGVDGRKEDLVPLDTDGFWWWVDINARDLGAPGQNVWLYALNKLNNKECRGLTKQEFIQAKSSGSYSMGWAIYAEWELV